MCPMWFFTNINIWRGLISGEFRTWTSYILTELFYLQFSFFFGEWMANASLLSCTTGERHFLALFSKFETTFRISSRVCPLKRRMVSKRLSWHRDVFFPSKKQPQYWIFTITLLACNHNYQLLSIIKAIKKHIVVRVVSLIFIPSR